MMSTFVGEPITNISALAYWIIKMASGCCMRELNGSLLTAGSLFLRAEQAHDVTLAVLSLVGRTVLNLLVKLRTQELFP